MASVATKPQDRTKAAGSGRLRVLGGALLLCLVALPLTRWLLFRKPAPPPQTASEAVWRDYWQKRIKDDVADVDAYVALGDLEESRGYSTVAVRTLTAARALGAPDEKVSGPLGRALLALARDDEALPEFEKAAKLHPDDLTATLNLAGLYAMRDQTRPTSELVKRFTDAHPNLPAGDLRRAAFAQLECGNYTEAKALADRILALVPDDPDAHGIATRCCIALKQFEEARKHTERLVALSNGEASVLYLHGLTLAALGREDEAIAQWEKTASLNPAALDAHERLGEAYYRRGDYAKAAAHFEALASRAPSVVTTGRAADAYAKRGDRGRSAYWRAVQVGLAGDFKTALSLAQVAAADTNPEIHRKGLQAVAEAYRGLRQKDQYLATMLKLTEGGTVADLLLRAHAYQEADRHEDRTRCLQEAVGKATEGEKPAILYELAKAYRVRGMRDEAEKSLEEAVQRDPKATPVYRELAKVYFERQNVGGRLEKSVHAWEQVIALNPTESSDWQNLGVAYASAGETGKAVTALERAVDLEPGNGPAYLELGRVYAKMGDREGAKTCNALYARFVTYDQQRQTLRSRANRPGATAEDVIAYGNLLVKAGALDEAAQAYEKACLLSPGNERVQSRLAALYRRLRQPDKAAALGGGTAPGSGSRGGR